MPPSPHRGERLRRAVQRLLDRPGPRAAPPAEAPRAEAPSAPPPTAPAEPDEMTADLETTAETVRAWIDAGEPVQLLDIREPHEMMGYVARDAWLVPMNTVPTVLAALPRDRKLVVYCAHGMRSYSVAHWLREQGFGQASSLAGGLPALADRPDELVQPGASPKLRPGSAVRLAPDSGHSGPALIQRVGEEHVDVLLCDGPGEVVSLPLESIG